MAIPTDIGMLVDGRKDGYRTEYEPGWDAERILRTVCAFANDLDGCGGGYIVVGVDHEHGYPEVVGLDRDAIGGMLEDIEPTMLRIV